MKNINYFLFGTLSLFVVIAEQGCNTYQKITPGALVIQEQGSFAVGGKVLTNPGTFNPTNPIAPSGQTLHGDHAYVFYQIPVKARKYPLVFAHGCVN